MNPDNLSPISPTNLPKTTTWKETIKEIAIFIFIVFCVFGIFRPYIAEPYLVDGRSMDPTFATGDYLIVDKISYNFKKPARNSVVIFKAVNANQPTRSFVKRIIGLPGETVKMQNNEVTIINKENPEGFALDQSYLFDRCDNTKSQCISDAEITLGENEYFVMGDNRIESYDSRYWGPLESKYITGRPILQLLPLGQMSILPGNDSK